MTTPSKKLYHNDEQRPRAPETDWGTSIVTVYDHAGQPHEMTATNARQNVSLNRWTLDEREAAARRENPLQPVKHLNFEHGKEGVTSRHLKPRTSSPVIGGVQQFPVTAPTPATGA